MTTTTRPAFITGANAKVKIGDKVFAYIMDLSYSLETETMPIESFGRYEIIANEPVSFIINGSFSVMRYTSALAGSIGVPVGTNWGSDTSASGLGFADQLNPAKMILSTMFDIEIFQKHSNTAGTAVTETSLIKLEGCRITNRRASLSKRGVLIDSYTFIGQLGGDTDVDTADKPSRSTTGGTI